ncbi:hypothetical protein JCM3766R1_004877 [Sporobolomyces carnicolor]
MPLPRNRHHPRSPKKTHATSNASTTPPKLPLELQDKVLDAFLNNLQDQGPADPMKAILHLPPLCLVSKFWESRLRHQIKNWISFDLRQRIPKCRYKRAHSILEDGHEEGDEYSCADETEYEPIDLELTENVVTTIAEGRCKGCAKGGFGSFALVVDGPDYRQRGNRSRRLIDSMLDNFGDFTEFQLCLDGPEAGCQIDLCRRFHRLRKLFVKSCPAIAVAFKPQSFSTDISSTLARLDLANVIIDDWKLSLAAVHTLTLSFVSFALKEDSSRDDELSRAFFASFPNLRAFALEGVENVCLSAFARLRVFSVKRLYFGDPHSTEPLAPAISRYFHCQITHLVFTRMQNSLPLLAELLSGRSGRAPPFLKRLQKIRLAEPRACCTGCDSAGCFKDFAEDAAREMLESVGLRDVEIEWWAAESSESRYDACHWEPSE